MNATSTAIIIAIVSILGNIIQYFLNKKSSDMSNLNEQVKLLSRLQKEQSAAYERNKKTTKQNIGKPLVRIAGEVDDFILTNSKFGESVGFKGFFTAVNLLTGEVFESNAAFIPNQITETLKEKLATGNSVFVEFDLMALESQKSPT